MLIEVLEENKLSAFEIYFLKNWVGKKDKGSYYRANDQARSLTILYSNKLREKMWSMTAPLLGIRCARQTHKVHAKNASC